MGGSATVGGDVFSDIRLSLIPSYRGFALFVGLLLVFLKKFTNRDSFLIVLEAQDLRSGCQHACPGEQPLSGCRLLTTPCVLTWQKEGLESSGLLYKSTKPTHKGCTLKT